MRYALYEYGFLKDVFPTLEKAIDTAEYCCETSSCHIQELKEGEDPTELSDQYNWINHYYYGDKV